MLKNAINALAEVDLEEFESEQDIEVFDISAKLNHNSVKKYYPLIQEYKAHHQKINSLYDELEAQGSLKKSKILKNIRGCYLRAKGKYVDNGDVSLDKIRKHADDIIDDILSELYMNLDKQGIYEDDIIIGLDLIMVDAFMRCKILEEPSMENSPDDHKNHQH